MNDVDPKDEQPDPELDTTAPNPADAGPPSDGWQMPEPKFQKSSGYLPQGYIDQLGLGEPGSPAVPAQATAEAPPAEPAEPPIDIEPQPDLAEQLEAEPVAAPPIPVKNRSSGSRIVMLVLGLLGMVLFIAAFLALVYFLFLAPQSGGSQF